MQGWDQTKLGEARVAILGSGPAAQYTAAALAALGVGTLEIYDSRKVEPAQEREALMYEAKQNQSRAKALEEILEKMNSSISVTGANLRVDATTLPFIGQPNLIIDTTNTLESRKALYEYAKENKVAVIYTAVDEQRAEAKLSPQELPEFKEYEGRKQGNIPSAVLGGMIAEETRKILMPLKENETPASELAYSMGADRRFERDTQKQVARADLSGKKVLIVGAGALGNFAALGAALEGVGSIDIMDDDEVESTNLNRQILFYDAVGKKKSSALADRLSVIVPGVKVKGIVDKLDTKSKYFESNKPDLIIDCVDSFAVRALINYYAVRNHIPLVSGGTDPRSGQTVVYEPGKSACLDCKLGVEKALAEQRRASSCRHTPDPSVIMTNQIVGSMMIGEALKVLAPEYGQPVRRILKYDSQSPARGGLIGLGDPCQCEKPEVGKWLKQVDSLLEVKK
ncbi:MAG: ThiF family adenylyltransferase [archaeon]